MKNLVQISIEWSICDIPIPVPIRECSAPALRTLAEEYIPEAIRPQSSRRGHARRSSFRIIQNISVKKLLPPGTRSPVSRIESNS